MNNHRDVTISDLQTGVSHLEVECGTHTSSDIEFVKTHIDVLLACHDTLQKVNKLESLSGLFPFRYQECFTFVIKSFLLSLSHYDMSKSVSLSLSSVLHLTVYQVFSAALLPFSILLQAVKPKVHKLP